MYSPLPQAILMYALDVERDALQESCGQVLPLHSIVTSVQNDVVNKVKKLIKAFDKAYNPEWVSGASSSPTTSDHAPLANHPTSPITHHPSPALQKEADSCVIC